MPRLPLVLVTIGIASSAADVLAKDCTQIGGATPQPDVIADANLTSYTGPIPAVTSIDGALTVLADNNGDGQLAICVEPGTYAGGFVIEHGAEQVWLYSSQGPQVTFIRGTRRGRVPGHGIEIIANSVDPGTPPAGARDDADVLIKGFDVAGYASVAPNANVSGAHGACLAAFDTALSLRKMVFSSCRSGGRGGAVHVADRDLRIRNSAFEENRADTGAAVDSRGPATIVRRTLFADNIAAGEGGAVYANGDVLYLGHVTAINNAADSSGGAVYAAGQSSVELAEGNYVKNTATGFNGGALWLDPPPSAVVWLEGTVLEGNDAGNDGGALYFAPTLTTNYTVHLEEVELRSNGAANYGGALFGRNLDLSLQGATVAGNTAHHHAGLYLMNSALTIAESTFEGNSAAVYTAALHVGSASGPVSITNSSFRGNQSASGPTGLIGVLGDHDVSFERVEIVENLTACWRLIAIDTPFLSISNALIAENSVDGRVLSFQFLSGTETLQAEYLTLAWNTVHNSNAWSQPLFAAASNGFITRSVLAFNGPNALQGAVGGASVTDTIVHQVGGGHVSGNQVSVAETNPVFGADPANPADTSLNEIPPWMYPASVDYDYGPGIGSPMIDPSVPANCHGSTEIGAFGGPNGCW